MAAESEPPLPEERDPREPGEGGRERYGPLQLLRTRKDDGRALLLFSRPEHPGEDDATGPPRTAGRA